MRRRKSSLQSSPWVQSGFVTALRQNERRGRDVNGGRMISCLFAIVSACLVLVWTAMNSIGVLGGTQASPSELVLEDRKKYGGFAIAKEQARGRKASGGLEAKKTASGGRNSSNRAEAKKAASGGGALVTLDGVTYKFCRECLFHREVGSCEERAKLMMIDRSISMEEAMPEVIKKKKECGKAAAEKTEVGGKKVGGVAIAKEQTMGRKASDGSGWGTLVTLDGVTYEFCRECLYHRKVGSCEERAKWMMESRSISMEKAMQDAIESVKECGKAVAKKMANGEKEYGGGAIVKEHTKGREPSDRMDAKKTASGGGTLVTLDGVTYEFCRECLYHREVGSCEVRAQLMIEDRSISMEEAMQEVIKKKKQCGQAVAEKTTSGEGTLVTLDGVTYEFCRECLYHRKVGSCEVRAKWMMESRSISMEEAMQDAIKNAKECGKESKGLVTVSGVSYEFCPECEFKGKQISCQQRVDWMVRTYNTPLNAAMESAVRQKRECGNARSN